MVFPSSPNVRSQRSPPSPQARPQRAHPDSRWRHGHDDPELQARRAGLSWQTLRRLAERCQRQQRPVGAHPPGRDWWHRESLPGCRCRHSGNQHLQRHPDFHGRLRHGRTGLRIERRRRSPGAQDRRCENPREPGQAAFRRRRARSYQPHLLAVAGREQPRLSQRDLR
ncbi:hypothetical protein D3C76_1224530 [compost metagenome]